MIQFDDHMFQMGGEKPILGGIKLDAFEGFPPFSVPCLGWCHIMTPVLGTFWKPALIEIGDDRDI